eukprot:4029760-Lingulodinium_polyedra.AAC.1
MDSQARDVVPAAPVLVLAAVDAAAAVWRRRLVREQRQLQVIMPAQRGVVRNENSLSVRGVFVARAIAFC